MLRKQCLDGWALWVFVPVLRGSLYNQQISSQRILHVTSQLLHFLNIIPCFIRSAPLSVYCICFDCVAFHNFRNWFLQAERHLLIDHGSQPANYFSLAQCCIHHSPNDFLLQSLVAADSSEGRMWNLKGQDFILNIICHCMTCFTIKSHLYQFMSSAYKSCTNGP